MPLRWRACSFINWCSIPRAIARVRCLRADTRMENGEIWTDTVFAVEQRDKGFLPTPIVVRMPGGKFQHLHSHVDGVPEFLPGEEVYLFLTGQPGRQFRIVGWAQGTFRVRKNGRNGAETVTQDSADVPVFDPQVNQFTKTGVKGLPSRSLPGKADCRDSSAVALVSAP